MTIKNFILQKAIKIIILLLIVVLMSCSATKSKGNDSMINSIENYISTYNSNKFKDSLDAIMISTSFIDNKTEYIISDAPKKVFLGDLNKYQQNKNPNIYFGSYNNVLCKIQSDSLEKYQHLFNDLEKSIQNEAQQVNRFQDENGKTYNFDVSLLNWNPNLTIIYNISDNKRKVIRKK